MTDEDHTKTIEVTVRTPAGHPHHFRFNDNTRVSTAAREATDYFVHERLIEHGDYGLALIRDGRVEELIADGARLEDYHIVDGDNLALYPKKPQVDGHIPVAG